MKNRPLRAALALAISSALGVSSCSQPRPTQLVIRVNAEDDGAGWLGTVRVQLRNTRTGESLMQPFENPVAARAFPMEWGLFPTEASLGATLEVTAEGIAPMSGGAIASRQRALVNYVPGRVIRIDMVLYRACTEGVETSCRGAGVNGEELTCDRGRCVPARRSTGVALDRDGAVVSIADASSVDVPSLPDSSIDPVDASVPPIDARDASLPDGMDSGVVTDTGVALDTGVAPPDSGVCAPRVVINEVQLRNNAGADREYIELFNAGSCTANLHTWRLVAKRGVVTPTVYSFSGTDMLPPGGYLLVAHVNTNFVSAPPVPILRWFDLDLLDDRVGGLRLEGAAPTRPLVDAVGWMESEAMGAVDPMFVEVAPIGYIVAQQVSFARRANGADTMNNSVDFEPNSPQSPGAANP